MWNETREPEMLAKDFVQTVCLGGLKTNQMAHGAKKTAHLRANFATSAPTTFKSSPSLLHFRWQTPKEIMAAELFIFPQQVCYHPEWTHTHLRIKTMMAPKWTNKFAKEKEEKFSACSEISVNSKNIIKTERPVKQHVYGFQYISQAKK